MRDGGRSRRRGEHPTGLLAGLEVFVALGAWVGVVQFATGGFGELVEKLPWQSPILAAAALAVCVAVPATVVAAALLLRTPWAPSAALLSAAVLACWLTGQVVLIGFSYFQPAYLLLAGFMAGLAREMSIRSRSSQPGVDRL